MQSFAVIGAGYGDEGKGIITDFLTHRLLAEDPIVARCNGGGQAAHTVQTPDGLRHVFKHHGSGTLLGAPTFLASTFITNPIIFREEDVELRKLGYTPKVLVSPDSLVTLPIDMILNQAMEEARGEERHGSCGVGIGETVQRSIEYAVRVRDLETMNTDTLMNLKAAYLSKRLKELGIPEPQHASNQVIAQFFVQNEIEYFLNHAKIVEDKDLTKHAGAVIFEGAQGLGLDQDRGHFPYVTRSSTGSTNIDLLAKTAGVGEVEKIYVTRVYNTRHGAGPLEWEGHDSGARVDDPTNKENPWQGALRSAPLDLDVLAKRIHEDGGKGQLAVTCLDQIQDTVTFGYDGALWKVAEDDIYDTFEHYTGMAPAFRSYGPTRADVKTA